MTKFGVWCCVSGGVTGHRTAWLKKHGALVIFADRESAASEAERLNQRMNHRHARAAFLYEPRELPEIIAMLAQQLAERRCPGRGKKNADNQHSFSKRLETWGRDRNRSNLDRPDG